MSSPNDDTKKLKDIFKLIDADAGGSISVNEVMVFVNSLEAGITRDEVAAMVTAGDTDGSGEVDENEFVLLAEELESKIGETIDSMVSKFCTWCYKDLFASLAEKDSTIRMTELRALIESMDIKELSDEDVRKMFTEHDDDGSGTIDSGEFANIAMSIGQYLPISNIVHGFKQARERSKARMAALKGKFHAEGVGGGGQALNPPPPPPPTIQKTVCEECPKLKAELERLKEELNKERRERAEQVGTLQNEKDALVEQLKEAEKKAKKTRKPSRTREPVVETAAPQNECARCLRFEGVDLDSLESQIWTLQTALEIRSREGEKLREKILEYAKDVDPLSRSLAERMRSGAGTIQLEAAKEAKGLFGTESIDAVLKKKKIVPKTKRESVVVIKEEVVRTVTGDESPGRVKELMGRVETLLGEKNKYKEIALQWKSRSEAMERDVLDMRERLRKAQEAIVSSAGVGFEKDIELEKTKKKVERLLRSASPQPVLSPSGIRSISPMSRSASGNPPMCAVPTHSFSHKTTPQHHASLRSYSASPDVQAQHHMALLRSHSNQPRSGSPLPFADLSTAPPGVRATIISTLNSPSVTFSPPPPNPPPAYFTRR
eukprot:TRINITY_DN8913_c0_g1_i1.p1 TRINITY_DN8913_c0_g1~~TRINITY_DN8913_c0_g1_i1.p1  ORF type:complete len:604 (+),score=100.24 TRINITY_DN8913_c0_g1_i1:386-2197(+)